MTVDTVEEVVERVWSQGPDFVREVTGRLLISLVGGPGTSASGGLGFHVPEVTGGSSPTMEAYRWLFDIVGKPEGSLLRLLPEVMALTVALHAGQDVGCSEGPGFWATAKETVRGALAAASHDETALERYTLDRFKVWFDAGGTWDKVESLVRRHLDGCAVYVYDLEVS